MREGKYIQDFEGRPEAKRQLGRPRSRWEDNIKVNLKELGWEVVNWFHLAQETD